MGDPDQAKIHFNPDFISRGGTLMNQKVHINPAFLQKSQGVQHTHKYVTPAARYGSKTGHKEQGWQGPASGAFKSAPQVTAPPIRTQNGNSPTNIYSYSSKSVLGHTIPSTHPKTHTLYKKNNFHNPYDTSFSTYKPLPQAHSSGAKSSLAMKHPSTYSWKASNTESLSTSLAGHNNVSLVKDSVFTTRHHAYQNPGSRYKSVNKSLIRTSLTHRVAVKDTHTHQHKDKLSVSPSSRHSVMYNKKITPSARDSVIVTANTTLNTSKLESGTAPSQIPMQRYSEKDTKNISPSLHIIKTESKAKSFPALPQSANGIVKTKEFMKSTKREISNICTPSEPQVLVSCSIATPVQGIPHQKFVSRNKVVNPSPKTSVHTQAADLKNNGTKIVAKTAKEKGNYELISKTKLVQTHPKSTTKTKVQQQQQQQAVSGGPAAPQGSKTTTYASPRVTTSARLKKESPVSTQQTATKLNTKKKYSVLSSTKLVRRQSVSGKTGTPGKPKYSVNTKNKLIRRRSNSGPKSPSKTSDSKPKVCVLAGKPKYSVNTKNKLIRRRSSSGSGVSKLLTKTGDSKFKTYKFEIEKQKKFHVLSKTKIVRRSSSGVYKATQAQGLAATIHSHSRKRGIVKKHKLVRNVSSTPLKHYTTKANKYCTRNVNTAFKVININPKLSAKQRVAKGIVSKYTINRLKLESYDGWRKYQKTFNRYKINRLKQGYATGSKRYKTYMEYSPKPKVNKKTCSTKHSDRFINIGGILYKSTKTSLRKQLPKLENKKTSVKKSDFTCTVFLRGEKFHLTAGGKTLQRVQDSTSAKSSLPRVHLGGLTYTRTTTGQYELTKTHQARAVLSSARQRSMVTLIHKRRKASFQKRNEYCVFFNRFGRCSKKNRGECPFIHDPNRVAICTRFLRGRCPVVNCPFSHTVDPHKMPVCSHFLEAVCTREDCPYRHIRVNPSAPVCLGFVRGYCKDGEECDKQHVLICEEFKTGKCPRGTSCPLSHHKGQKQQRKVSFSRNSSTRPSTSTHRKRKRSESREVLGGPVVKRKVEKKRKVAKSGSSHQRYFHVAGEGSKDEDEHKLPENIDLCDNSKHNNCDASTQNPAVTPSASDSQVSQAVNQGNETTKDQIEVSEKSCSSPTTTTVLEDTRSRVLRKIDKMKKTYGVLNGENFSEGLGNQYTISKTGEPSDSLHPGNTNQDSDNSNNQKAIDEISKQSCSEIENPDRDTVRVQRPLPKRLPSYIPLDCVE